MTIGESGSGEMTMGRKDPGIQRWPERAAVALARNPVAHAAVLVVICGSLLAAVTLIFPAHRLPFAGIVAAFIVFESWHRERFRRQLEQRDAKIDDLKHGRAGPLSSAPFDHEKELHPDDKKRKRLPNWGADVRRDDPTERLASTLYHFTVYGGLGLLVRQPSQFMHVPIFLLAAIIAWQQLGRHQALARRDREIRLLARELRRRSESRATERGSPAPELRSMQSRKRASSP